MLICKVCGAANASNTTVCASCGTTLSSREKKSDSNEIFSSKNTDSSSVKSVSSNEIYSSRSIYNEAQQKKIFEKIRKQEEALGDTEVELPKVKKEVSTVPDKPLSQVKVSADNNYKSKPSSSKNHRIPQRIIESVDKQMIQQKMKPTCKPKKDEEIEDGKVELTSSKVIEEIHEKHEQTLQMRKLKAAQQRKTPGSLNDKESQKKRERILEKEQNQKLKQLEKKRILEEKQAIKSEKAESKHNKKGNSNTTFKPSVSDNPKVSAGVISTQNKTAEKSVTNSRASGSEKTLNNKLTAQKSMAQKTENKSDTSVKKRPLPNSASVPNKNISVKSVSVQNSINQKKTANSGSEVSSKNKNTAQSTAKKTVAVGNSTESKTKVHSGQPVGAQNTEAVTNKSPNKNIAKPSSQVSAKSSSVSKHSDSQKSQVIPSGEKKIKATKNKSVSFEFSEEDIAKNRYTAALSYIGILFIIPYAKRKESDFCKAHAKQGILLFFMTALFLALTLILVIGLRFLLVWYFRVPYVIYSALYYLIFLGSAAAIFVPVFKGTESAINGTYLKFPFIGKKADK